MDDATFARYSLDVDRDTGRINGFTVVGSPFRLLADEFSIKPMTRWQRFKNWVRSIW